MIDAIPLQSVLNRLPKVSLHDHLDGALRPSTVLELADTRGIRLPVADEWSLPAWIKAECEGSLSRYLAVSDLLVELLAGDVDAIARVAREYVEDLAADGVVYAEARWAPEELAVNGASLTDVLDAVADGIRLGVDTVRGRGLWIDVRQILCAIRTERRSTEIAELVLAHRDAGVVGFDLAGAEVGAPASDHAAAFELLRRQSVPVTVHAGEADGLASIRDALDLGSVLRLGHGARLADDVSTTGDGTPVLGDLATMVRASRVALELCPSSNLQTDTSRWPDVRHHPFDLLKRAGFIVTVSPDNRLLSGTTVTQELSLLVDAFGYDISDVEQFQLDAAAASFLPPAEKTDLRSDIAWGFSAVRA